MRHVLILMPECLRIISWHNRRCHLCLQKNAGEGRGVIAMSVVAHDDAPSAVNRNNVGPTETGSSHMASSHIPEGYANCPFLRPWLAPRVRTWRLLRHRKTWCSRWQPSSAIHGCLNRPAREPKVIVKWSSEFARDAMIWLVGDYNIDIAVHKHQPRKCPLDVHLLSNTLTLRLQRSWLQLEWHQRLQAKPWLVQEMRKRRPKGQGHWSGAGAVIQDIDAAHHCPKGKSSLAASLILLWFAKVVPKNMKRTY